MTNKVRPMISWMDEDSSWWRTRAMVRADGRVRRDRFNAGMSSESMKANELARARP
jgi:hypothetical protein